MSNNDLNDLFLIQSSFVLHMWSPGSPGRRLPGKAAPCFHTKSSLEAAMLLLLSLVSLLCSVGNVIICHHTSVSPALMRRVCSGTLLLASLLKSSCGLMYAQLEQYQPSLKSWRWLCKCVHEVKECHKQTTLLCYWPVIVFDSNCK